MECSGTPGSDEWPIDRVRELVQSPGILVVDDDAVLALLLDLDPGREEGVRTLRWVADEADLAARVQIVWADNVLTDEAWEHLGRFPSLRQLSASLEAGVGEGVRHLRGLRYLSWRSFLSVKAARELASLPELRDVMLNELDQSTDEHLFAIAGSQSIEGLSILRTTSITDAGIAKLATISTLRCLYIGMLPDVTTRGVLQVLQTGRLERLIVRKCPNVDMTVVRQHAAKTELIEY